MFQVLIGTILSGIAILGSIIVISCNSYYAKIFIAERTVSDYDVSYRPLRHIVRMGDFVGHIGRRKPSL